MRQTRVTSTVKAIWAEDGATKFSRGVGEVVAMHVGLCSNMISHVLYSRPGLGGCKGLRWNTMLSIPDGVERLPYSTIGTFEVERPAQSQGLCSWFADADKSVDGINHSFIRLYVRNLYRSFSTVSIFHSISLFRSYASPKSKWFP